MHAYAHLPKVRVWGRKGKKKVFIVIEIVGDDVLDKDAQEKEKVERPVLQLRQIGR